MKWRGPNRSRSFLCVFLTYVKYGVSPYPITLRFNVILNIVVLRFPVSLIIPRLVLLTFLAPSIASFLWVFFCLIIFLVCLRLNSILCRGGRSVGHVVVEEKNEERHDQMPRGR